jgi:hypothetical protein
VVSTASAAGTTNVAARQRPTASLVICIIDIS